MKRNIADKFKGDFVLWTIIFVLCIYSALAVYSGIAKRVFVHVIQDGADSSNQGSDFRNHLFILITGLVVMWIIHKIKWYNALQKSAYFLLGLAFVLLILTILFGSGAHANRQLWFFQTFDIAKACMIIYLATVFSNKKELINQSFKQMAMNIYLPVIAFCALVGKENASTAGLLFITVVILMFFAHIRLKYIGILIGMVVIGILLVSLAYSPKSNTNQKWEKVARSRTGTVWSRTKNFFCGDRDINSQEFNATLAIAKGGLTGKMPGKSEQRYYLAKVESDYIFAIIVEEYGFFAGALLIILSFLIIMYRGFRIALNSKRLFSAYLVLGITFLYVTQAFIHILVSLDWVPVTGQPMPFVSKGGTMFMVCCTSFGFVLSESRINEEEKANEQREQNEKANENGI